MGNRFSTPNLVYRLEHGSAADKEIAAEYLVSKVKQYSTHKDYVQAVGKYATKHLVELAKNGTERGKQYAAAALSYLALEQENKDLIIKEGAVPVLVGLAKTGTIEQKGAAAVAFANLGNRSAANQKKIIEAGAIQPLLKMVKESEDGHHQVRSWAASAVGNLCSQNPEIQEKLGAAGAIDALIDMLSAKMPAFALQSQDGLMVKAHDMVTCRRRKHEPPKGPTMAESAARNLNMLLYSHKLNQERLVKADGIVALLKLVKEGAPKEGVEALRTVGNVWGGISAEVANAKLVDAGGIDLLVEVAQTRELEAREAAAGLLTRLVASAVDYKAKFVEAGGLVAMVKLFESGSPQARIWATRALSLLATASDENRQKIMDLGGSTALEIADARVMRVRAANEEEAKLAAEEIKATEEKEKPGQEKQDESETRQRKGGSEQAD